MRCRCRPDGRPAFGQRENSANENPAISRQRRQEVGRRVRADEPRRVRRKRIFRAAGSERDGGDAIIADHLVEANLVGHDSHGVIRIRKYVDWASAGLVLPNRHVEIVDRSRRVAASRRRLRLRPGDRPRGDGARRRARAGGFGFAVVAIRNAGHLGRIGAWAEQLAAAGLRLLSFRQHVRLRHPGRPAWRPRPPPVGQPDRRRRAGRRRSAAHPRHRHLGRSPKARSRWRATSARRSRPARSSTAPGGRPTDPEAFYANPPGAILPFGGHKGSGLSLFCEILAGSLTGGFASHPTTPTAGRLVNNMLSIVFDPAAFAGADFFAADLARLMAWTKASPPLEPGGAVLLPGEIELRTRREREANGIPLDRRDAGADRRGGRRQSESACDVRGPLPGKVDRCAPIRFAPGSRTASAVYGMFATEFFSPGLCQIAANAGAEFVLFDMEHGGVGIDVAQGAVRLRPRHRHRAARARARPCTIT